MGLKVHIGGILINNVRFTDDAAVMADELHILLEIINRAWNIKRRNSYKQKVTFCEPTNSIMQGRIRIGNRKKTQILAS